MVVCADFKKIAFSNLSRAYTNGYVIRVNKVNRRSTSTRSTAGSMATRTTTRSTTSTLFIATTTNGRGTSSVVSFVVVAMNRVNVVDLVVDLVDVDVPFC